MATSAGLPESLTEFLDVWCGDVLARLESADRRRLVNGIHLMCAGGVAWPTRLYVQRLVEIVQGRVNEEAVQGELLDLHGGGVAGALERLCDPDLRAAALCELGKFQPTVELIRRISAAHEDGLLTALERVTVLSQALRLPDLPDPVPLPAGLVPVPLGYPAVGQAPVRGRHGPVERQSTRLVPAMVSYVPQRAGVRRVPVAEPLSEVPWASTSGAREQCATPQAAARFHDGVDAFLRARGWSSGRDREHGTVGYDEWIWPPSEDEPWWQPTIIDFDGSRFRVRLASPGLMEEPLTQYLMGDAEVRREIASIEEWTRRSSPEGPSARG